MFQVISASTLDPPAAACRLVKGALLLVVDDGTGRLLHLDGLFIGLNVAATAILVEGLRSSFEHAVVKLAASLQVETSQIRHDMLDLLAQLARLRLILCEGSGGVRPSIGCSFRATSLAAFIRCVARLPLSIERRVSLLLSISFLAIRTLGLATSFSACGRAGLLRELDRDLDARLDKCRRIRQTIEHRSARSWLPITCKERALCGYAMAQQSGVPVEVVLAVDLYPFRTHCWCQSENVILSDDPDHCSTYQPVATLLKSPPGDDASEGLL